LTGSDVILSRGLPTFRTCDTNRSRIACRFPEYFVERWGWKPSTRRFVAQLYGCHLDCAYCSIHLEGVWGRHTGYSTAGLITEFTCIQDFNWAHQDTIDTLDTFHLSGGAPELYMGMWPALIESLKENAREQTAFHSDLTLSAHRYQSNTLNQLQTLKRNCMFAVNVKGWSPDEYFRLTRKKQFNPALMLDNLEALLGWGIPLYITYTGMAEDSIDRFEQAAAKRVEGWGEHINRWRIPIHAYNAMNVTSTAQWGTEFVPGSG